jgi:hypothetical protein
LTGGGIWRAGKESGQRRHGVSSDDLTLSDDHATGFKVVEYSPWPVANTAIGSPNMTYKYCKGTYAHFGWRKHHAR